MWRRRRLGLLASLVSKPLQKANIGALNCD
jgi:hypothetical protein